MTRAGRSLLTLGLATLVLGSALTAAEAKDRDERGKHGKDKKEARHDVRRADERRGPGWRPDPRGHVGDRRDWQGHPHVQHPHVRHPHVQHRVYDRRPDVHWHFDRGRGWRWAPHPGVWSAPYSWWWVNRQVVLLAAPTVTVVQYPHGRYELRGDGVRVPYHWAWIPIQYYAYAAAPPPPAPPADALVAPGIPEPPPPPPPLG